MGINNNLSAVSQKPSGWRGSRDIWLIAAKKAFIESGLDAVKIQPLANQLGLSRTSFYWFFKDRNALLDALLDDWETKNTGAFLNVCCAFAETISEAILNLIAMFYDDNLFEPQLDFAVRSWAHQSTAVKRRINRTDEQRLAAIREMFKRFDFTDDEADVRARTVYLVRIGYISMQVQESLATRMVRVPSYVKTYCGRAPTKREMARFYANLDYDPEK